MRAIIREVNPISCSASSHLASSLTWMLAGLVPWGNDFFKGISNFSCAA